MPQTRPMISEWPHSLRGTTLSHRKKKIIAMSKDSKQACISNIYALVGGASFPPKKIKDTARCIISFMNGDIIFINFFMKH